MEIKYPFHYAKYTIQLQDALIEDATLLDDIVLETDLQTNTFKEIFIVTYAIYEIGAETLQEFKSWVANHFKMHKKYIQEMINAYETKINWQNGRITSREYSENKTNDFENNIKNSSEDTNYALPNKNISSPNGYPTGSNTNTGISNNTGFDKYNYERTEYITGDVNIVTQWASYRKALDDIYYDFMKYFKNLFIQRF